MSEVLRTIDLLRVCSMFTTFVPRHTDRSPIIKRITRSILSLASVTPRGFDHLLHALDSRA